MKRGTWSLRGGALLGVMIVVAAETTAHAGSVTFTALGPTSVMAGTNIDFDVDMQASADFDLTNILIGSSTVTDLTFLTDPSWDLAFQAGSSTVIYDEVSAPPAFSQNVFLEGDIVGSGTTGPNLAVGALTIDTAGMLPGVYSVGVSTLDSYAINIGEGGDEDPLVSTGLIFTILPEPASALLLLAGVIVLRPRSR